MATDTADDPEERPTVVPAYIMRAVPMRPPWRQLRNHDGDIVHIVPTADLVLHSTRPGVDCVCGPTELIAPGHEGHDHPDIWVHQHHALDGRELPRLR